MPAQPDPNENAQIVELRTKLEVRTWILRASVALNVALVGGLLVKAALG